MLKFTAALIPAALLAAPAMAQVAPQGPRAEAIIGYDAISTGDDFDDVDSDGVLYGIGAGYDFAVGPTFSLGIDVEATGSSIEESEVGFVDGVGYEASVGIDSDLYAGVRATFPISDGANAYLKGGVTRIDAEYGVRFDDDVAGFEFNEEDTGYRVGAGLQFNLGERTYVAGEYRYSGYDDDLSRHQLAASVGIRF